MSYTYLHAGAAFVVIAGAVIGALLLYRHFEERSIRKQEREQEDRYLSDQFSPTTLLSRDPRAPRPTWNGETYDYPQSWEWPEHQTVTQFLEAAPALTAPMPAVTAQQPVVGIRTAYTTGYQQPQRHPSGPLPAALNDTDEFILQMQAHADAVIARLCAPLAETSW